MSISNSCPDYPLPKTPLPCALFFLFEQSILTVTDALTPYLLFEQYRFLVKAALPY
jgi:hypothetical protein